MTAHSGDLAPRLKRWAEAHALVTLGATALALLGSSLWPLIAAAALSFAALVWGCRDGWPRPGRFDPANTITAARLAGVLALPVVGGTSPWLVAICALTLFALDGVDGWLARKLRLGSEFGEYFDKEADALLMLILCLLLFDSGRLGAWIVVPGVLRYGFVVCLMWMRPRALKERRSRLGRWIYFGMISALIAAFTPYPEFYRPLVVLMTLALAYSFAIALMDLCRVRMQTEPPDCGA